MKRQPANLSEALCHRLNVYALTASGAGVGILALVRPAEAKIVYTKANVKIGFQSEEVIDIDHDGDADLVFRDNTHSGNGRQSSYLTVEGGVSDAFVEQFRDGKKLGATALKPGKSIGPHHRFSRRPPLNGALMADECGGCSSEGRFFGPWANYGKGVRNRYLGVKVTISGQTHYGWVRMNVSINSFPEITATVTGYAYETIPNKPIIAGRTKGRDVITMQEGTLGALAAGASGLEHTEVMMGASER